MIVVSNSAQCVAHALFKHVLNAMYLNQRDPTAQMLLVDADVRPQGGVFEYQLVLLLHISQGSALHVFVCDEYVNATL